MTGLKDLLRIERARHFLVALAIAATLGAVWFLEPLDWLIWNSHARVIEREASGDIVFVGAVDDLSDPTRPQHRRDLARLVEGLGDAGAARIFLDVRLEEPSNPEADRALSQAIAQGRRTYLVDRFQSTSAGPRMLSTIPSIADGAPRVIARQLLDAFGWTWLADRGSYDNGIFRQSFAGALGNVPPKAGKTFRIDYSINYRSVPSFSMPDALSALESNATNELFANKFVVIGNGGVSESAYAAIPGHRKVPASMVAILAGETLRAGPGVDVGWVATFIAFAVMLASIIFFSPTAKFRYRGYAFVALSVPAWFLLSTYLRVTPHLTAPIALGALYAVARIWNVRNRNASLVDELSGLPNFRALQKHLARQGPMMRTTVVVARIHRFDEVLAILPPENHGQYVRLVAERLRITEHELIVYSHAGRYLAWVQQSDDDPQLEAHLHGLRAVFGSPLYLDGTPIDVGITFGADSTREASPSRRIASAIAAVDRTTESHSPVQFADTSSVSDRMWNVSLQSKIDEALKGGQIYVVYQPQFDLPSEAFSGFEALVRWNDPERGTISPSYFIEQCEHAGRMEALTRKVFSESIEAISQEPFAGSSCRLSLNVSATMLGDERILDILQQTLSSSRLDPARLTVEITETARIADFDRARTVLTSLQAFGIRTSIDDFGVGAANLETLLRLPFHELKIDRAFVSRVTDNAKAREIVQSLIALGRGIGLDVVAEGVEDRSTLETLKTFGCGGVQGFLLGKPGPLSESEKYLRERDRRLASSPC